MNSVKDEKERALSVAPEGTLRICCSGKKPQYYRRVDKKDTTGIYIPRKDICIAKRLGQKDYDKKILSVIQKELKAIEAYMTNCPDVCVEDVYQNLHIERQKLIAPIEKTEEQYVKDWENIVYTGKGIGDDVPELYTEKGERVRSKSEVIIADILNREGIPYKYECPVYLEGMGKVYPDFTVLNVRLRQEFYWEHLGMLDEPDYLEKALRKIEKYEQNGIFVGEQLLLTCETKKHPINRQQILRVIRHKLI